MSTDYAFAELGLDASASEPEVRAAWRRLASHWHPDRNASHDALARMQRINRAFEDIRRAGFRFTATPAAAATPPPPPHTPAPTTAPRAAPQADAGPRRKPVARKLKLSLEEATLGGIHRLRGRYTRFCAGCDGVGHQVLAGHCSACDGSGQVTRRGWFGWPGHSSECEACRGSGEQSQTCTDCGGEGKTTAQPYQVDVRLPPGLRDGDLLHVDGRRSNRPTPDLEIRVELAPHPFFTLEDNGTLHCELPVDGFAWTGQRRVQVPTPDGPQPLQLQRGQCSYRLPGQGFPVTRRGPRADLLVTVLPVFPERLSSDQEILLDQLIASACGPDGVPTDARLRQWSRQWQRWQQTRTGRQAQTKD